MMDARRTRSLFAFGLVAVAGATYACGSGQEAPPNTGAQAQADNAAPAAAGSDGHHHHLPPPAAFDACKDKAVGADCTVMIHDDEINGKCENPPPGSSQNAPACRPERQHKKPHGPPPEAVFAACDGKTSGDACTVQFESKAVNGS